MLRLLCRTSASFSLGLLLAAAQLATSPTVAYGDQADPADYDILNGHFYSQGSSSPGGFRITDEYGVTFWTEFRARGGVERLGYPISRRFIRNGLVGQAMQYALLYWTPHSEAVRVASLAGYLVNNDVEWATSDKSVPELLKEAGLLPEEALEPEDTPLEPGIDTRRRTASSRVVSASSRGLATWYGNDFQGLPMRNGDPFHPADETTTAANVYPLGSWLRVTNSATKKSIDVRVTDTGGFRYPVIVDLSLAAFARLADPDKGVIEVSVLPLHRE